MLCVINDYIEQMEKAKHLPTYCFSIHKLSLIMNKLSFGQRLINRSITDNKCLDGEFLRVLCTVFSNRFSAQPLKVIYLESAVIMYAFLHIKEVVKTKRFLDP